MLRVFVLLLGIVLIAIGIIRAIKTKEIELRFGNNEVVKARQSKEPNTFHFILALYMLFELILIVLLMLPYLWELL